MRQSRQIWLGTILILFIFPNAFAETDFPAFWNKFKSAVIAGDKATVLKMTKFPLSMQYGVKAVKTKSDFLRRYNEIFNGEANAAQCFRDSNRKKNPVDMKSTARSRRRRTTRKTRRSALCLNRPKAVGNLPASTTSMNNFRQTPQPTASNSLIFFRIAAINRRRFAFIVVRPNSAPMASAQARTTLPHANVSIVFITILFASLFVIFHAFDRCFPVSIKPNRDCLGRTLGCAALRYPGAMCRQYEFTRR